MNRITLKTGAGIVTAAMIAVSFGALSAQPAAASPSPAATTAAATAAVAKTTQRMSGPSLDSGQAGTYQEGTQIGLVCYARGQRVQGQFSNYIPAGGWDDLWYRAADGRWVADVDIDTGTNNPVAPACPTRMFQPDLAVAYAFAHVYDDGDLESDCTYFTSQAWWYAGLPQSDQWRDGATRDLGWGLPPLPVNTVYGTTPAAASADWFKNYVVDQGYATIKEIDWSDSTAAGAQPGDVIAYDWDNGADGKVDHLALVVGLSTVNGQPIIMQHSPSRTRYWSLDGNGTPLTQTAKYKGARAYLLHEIG